MINNRSNTIQISDEKKKYLTEIDTKNDLIHKKNFTKSRKFQGGLKAKQKKLL